MIEIKCVQESDIPEIMDLMELAKNLTKNPDWYSTDDENFVRRHIDEEGFILKAVEGECLAGFLIARYPKEVEDNLGNYWNLTDNQMQKVAHMESAAVHPDFRGRGIQKMLMAHAEAILVQEGYRYLMGTAHPDNVYSVNNFLKLGYEILTRTEKYGGLPRYVFGKTVAVLAEDYL